MWRRKNEGGWLLEQATDGDAAVMRLLCAMEATIDGAVEADGWRRWGAASGILPMPGTLPNSDLLLFSSYADSLASFYVLFLSSLFSFYGFGEQLQLFGGVGGSDEGVGWGGFVKGCGGGI